MPTVTGAIIVNRVATTLIDNGHTRWTTAELTDYLAASINLAVGAKPNIYVLTSIVALTPGVIQTLPSGGLRLQDVIMTGNGIPVRQIERDALMHSYFDGWTSVGAVQDIQHFTFDKRNLKMWYNFPPAASGAQAQICYEAVPPRYTDTTGATVIPIDDIYENTLYYAVLAFAYAKNTNRGDMLKAQGYLTLSGQFLGARLTAELAFSSPPEDSPDPSSLVGVR